jgi:hypothetical protein
VKMAPELWVLSSADFLTYLMYDSHLGIYEPTRIGCNSYTKRIYT